GSNSTGTQGVAIGIALSRIAFDKEGSATVQNAFEKVADPTARTASYSAFLQDGSNRTTLSTPAGGSTTALRRVGSDGVPLDQLGRPRVRPQRPSVEVHPHLGRNYKRHVSDPKGNRPRWFHALRKPEDRNVHAVDPRGRNSSAKLFGHLGIPVQTSQAQPRQNG
ncbi:hypothetical protein L2U97_14340, partial [Staphylococcus aureus]|nr:hypothetical protein [Staphylococcus aureus]